MHGVYGVCNLLALHLSVITMNFYSSTLLVVVIVISYSKVLLGLLFLLGSFLCFLTFPWFPSRYATTGCFPSKMDIFSRSESV